MLRNFFLFAVILFLISCSTTFQKKQHIEVVDLCPLAGFEPRPEVTALYWVMLTDLAKENVHVGDLTCEKGSRPLMELRISGTHIADTQERWGALGTTTLGVAAPVAMIMMGFPIILFWWDIPENNLVYALDLENTYETEDVVIKRQVSTSSFFGPPETHILRQRDAFRTDLERLLDQNFGKK